MSANVEKMLWVVLAAALLVLSQVPALKGVAEGLIWLSGGIKGMALLPSVNERAARRMSSAPPAPEQKP